MLWSFAAVSCRGRKRRDIPFVERNAPLAPQRILEQPTITALLCELVRVEEEIMEYQNMERFELERYLSLRVNETSIFL